MVTTGVFPLSPNVTPASAATGVAETLEDDVKEEEVVVKGRDEFLGLTW